MNFKIKNIGLQSITASSAGETAIRMIPPTPTALITHAEKGVLDAAHVGEVNVLKTIGSNYRYIVDNIGAAAWTATQVDGTTKTLTPATYHIVTDTAKDELLDNYGSDIVVVDGSCGYDDENAVAYVAQALTNTWTLYDMGRYSGNFVLNNLGSTDVYFSFSGAVAGVTGAAPPVKSTIVMSGTTKREISLFSTMNPERYFYACCTGSTGATGILEVIGV